MFCATLEIVLAHVTTCAHRVCRLQLAGRCAHTIEGTSPGVTLQLKCVTCRISGACLIHVIRPCACNCDTQGPHRMDRWMHAPRTCSRLQAARCSLAAHRPATPAATRMLVQCAVTSSVRQSTLRQQQPEHFAHSFTVYVFRQASARARTSVTASGCVKPSTAWKYDLTSVLRE